MHRWFTILLLLLLPTQFSWAAMTAYCGHEQGVAAKHLGHHDHVHKAGSAESSQEGKKPQGSVDADCAICHLGCAQDVSSSAQMTHTSSVDSEHFYTVIFRSHIPSGLERPDRRLAY